MEFKKWEGLPLKKLDAIDGENTSPENKRIGFRWSKLLNFRTNRVIKSSSYPSLKCTTCIRELSVVVIILVFNN